MTTHDMLRARLYAQAGLTQATQVAQLDILKKTEWSPRFEQLMRNRLIMGALRYGQLNVPNKRRWDRVTAAEQRLAKYRETGNLELLVDVANFMLLEFEEGHHPLRHWAATDDGQHVKEL